MSDELRYDVIAVNIKTHQVRMIAHDKDARNAEAIIKMAVMRRGIEEEFYTTAAHGAIKDGDQWGELL